MPDIRLVQNTEFPNHPDYSVTMDWSLQGNGALDESQALATAVVVALGTDALASRDDILPDPDSSDRAGWWGDYEADVWDGWPIGCKLWLLKRAKITGPGAWEGETVGRVERYIMDAIQPFVDRGICTSFIVKAGRVGRERIDALVKIFRGPLPEIELRFQVLWEGIMPTDPIGPYFTR